MITSVWERDKSLPTFNTLREGTVFSLPDEPDNCNIKICGVERQGEAINACRMFNGGCFYIQPNQKVIVADEIRVIYKK